MAKQANSKIHHRDEPTYWFAVLEIAKEQGDFDSAAEAQRELRRLGVIVRYERSSPEGKGAPHAF